MVPVRDELLSLCDSIREVRRSDLELPHARMQPLEGIHVVGWRNFSWYQRCVVGPQRDHEAVTLVEARLPPRLKSTHRALGLGEPLRQIHFELCDLMQSLCDSG